MPKLFFLINHTPNPRILKRCRALDEVSDILLVYWDRLLDIDREFKKNKNWDIRPIKLKAHLGYPFYRFFLLVIFFLKVFKVLKKEKPNVIYAEKIDMLFIAWVYKKTVDKNVKIIYEVADLIKIKLNKNKDFSFNKILYIIIFNIEKRMNKSVDLLVLTSRYHWEEYYKDIISKDKYLLMLNVPPKKLFRNFKKTEHNDIIIGYIGSIRYPKQLKMLIDVVSSVEEMSVFIAGDGSNYEEIKNYSKDKEYVEFYGPYNYFEEINNLYSKIDCVFSVYDTNYSDNIKIAFPNKLYEAINCELPIIVAKNTKVADFVKNKKIGFAVDDSSKMELKNVLLKLKNKKIIKEINFNIKSIKKKYYLEKYNDELISNFKEIIKKID